MHDLGTKNSKVEQFSNDCRKWLSQWDYKTWWLTKNSRASFSTNEEINQNHLVRATFPALWASCRQFLGILLGPLCCLLLLWLIRVMFWRWFFGIRLKTTLSTVCRVRTVDLEQLFSTFRCFKNKYKSGRHSADALFSKSQSHSTRRLLFVRNFNLVSWGKGGSLGMRLRSHGKRCLNITIIMLCVGASFSLSLTRKLNLFFAWGASSVVTFTSANNIGCFAELS